MSRAASVTPSAHMSTRESPAQSPAPSSRAVVSETIGLHDVIVEGIWTCDDVVQRSSLTVSLL